MSDSEDARVNSLMRQFRNDTLELHESYVTRVDLEFIEMRRNLGL